MIEFLHKILRIFILKKVICKVQVLSNSRENFEVLFLFIFFVKYCSSFRFLKALACKMPIKHRTRSSWLNCALRDDEAAYWVSIGHNEAVAVSN